MTMCVNTLQSFYQFLQHLDSDEAEQKCAWGKKVREDLQGLRVFRVQEVPVTDFGAALVISCAWADQEAALGGVGDRH